MYPRISPIRLLRGHSTDTATTGSGCAMDVASYLAGDEKITDSPKCVSPVFHMLFRELNDLMMDDSRHRLIPYLLRAMQTGEASKQQQRAWLDQLDTFVRGTFTANRHLDRLDRFVSLFGFRAKSFILGSHVGLYASCRSDSERREIEYQVLRWLNRVLPPLDSAYITPEIRVRAQKFCIPLYA